MKYLPLLGTNLSGSIGGITAARTSGTGYFRAKSNPVNPNTGFQQAIRSAFGELVQMWTSTLSDAQRTAWRVYAQTITITDSIGQSGFRTGQQHFIGSNTPRLQAGLAPVLNAPTIFNTGMPITGMTAPGFQIATEAWVVSFSRQAADEDGTLLVYIGQPQNESREFFDGSYRLFGNNDAITSASTNPQITGDLTPANGILPGPWGPLTDGDRVRLRARISYDDGRLSQPFETWVTVVGDS